jgi:tetratricopeptide (TPR) repeat protein
VVAVAVLSGGIGWVASDHAARAEATAGEITKALDDSSHWQQRRRLPEALAAARQAQAALSGGHADAALRRRVEARMRDLDLLSRLDEARLEGTAMKDGYFDHEHADRRYVEILREFNLDVEAGSAEEAGARCRDTTVELELAAFLDDWAIMRRYHIPQHKAKWKRLLEVASIIDPDGWRSRLRQALAGRDPELLARLAAGDKVAHLLPWTLSALTRALQGAGSAQPAEALLREAQRRHPDDFWINEDLGMLIREAKERGIVEPNPRRHEEALPFLTAAVALRPQSPGAHLNLSNALFAKGDLDGAIAELRAAIRLKKDYAEAHINLGNALRAKGDLDGAIAACREAIRLKKDYAAAHCNLGAALGAKGDVDGAIAAFRKALRLKKDYAVAHSNLGAALRAKGDLDGAIAACREALRLKKDYAEPHSNLGIALHAKGQLDEAIAAYQQAVRLKKDFPEAHNNLGTLLGEKGQLDEAIAEFREALHLKKDYAFAHNNLGLALQKKGQLDEAIAEFREALRLKRDDARGHYNLGVTLGAKGRRDEAITAYREAIRLKKDFAEAHCNLGDVLEQKGLFAEALVHRRRGHELGSKNPNWPHPSAQWVRNCERLVELDGKLPAILSGQSQPANAAERLDLAAICQRKKRHVAATRFYGEVFAEKPQLAADLRFPHRYNAACSAALAGCGQGEDAAGLGEKERARLRRQAGDWLRDDLAAYRTFLEKQPDKVRPAVIKTMRHWLADPDFAGVRGEKALAKLPEAERRAWRKLWDAVADTLAQAQEKRGSEEKKPSPAEGPQQD